MTLTLVVQLPWLPDPSVAIRLTLLIPKSLQLNANLLNESVGVNTEAQLSFGVAEEISVVLNVASPLVLRARLNVAEQEGVGAIVSMTVTWE